MEFKKPVGNPNIANTPNIGPKTQIGKLRCSLHRVNTGLQVSKNSMAGKAVGFDGSKEKLQAYHNFVSFVLGHPIKTLSEIERLEGLMSLMEANLSKAIEKLEKGEELSDKDRKNMYLVKDILVDLNKIKYGEKRININADLKDIRDAMFEQ